MRTETIVNEVYNFSELNEIAQNKAIEKIRDSSGYLNYDWWHYNQFIEDLEKLGFEDVKIKFSGFYSQGDGACFDANINLSNVEGLTINEKRIVKLIENNYINNFEIVKCGVHYHYVHENTRKIEGNFYDSRLKNVEKVYNELCDKLEKIRYDKCKEIYKGLESQYDYLNSDEAIKEHIECNDLEFYEDGKQY